MKKVIKLSESNLRNIIRNIFKESKESEIWQSWNDIDNMYDNSPDKYYHPRGKRDNGYTDEWIRPQEELEMYQSMGNPSQYATKGEHPKWVRNKDGYGYHSSPERYDDGHLSIAAQSDPVTYRQQDGYDDDNEAPIAWKSGVDGGKHRETTSSYARDVNNFGGNEDMHDLENDRIHQANYDAEHELDYLKNLDEGKISRIIKRSIKKVLG